MTRPTRVLIVDDDALVRAGLAMMLGGDDSIRVVGEAGDGVEAVEQVAQLGPDVVLMDIRMPRLDGLAATERLVERGMHTHVIILTTFDDDQHVLRALRAGAAGFLLKDTPPAQIVRAIAQVMEGEPMLSPTIIRKLINQVASDPAAERRDHASELLADLTERERDVALAVAEGKTNAEIGDELHLAVASVKAIVSRVMHKLEVTNRVQVALVVRDGS